MTKKNDGQDKKDTRSDALATLESLAGKLVSDMSKAELSALITALGQLLNVINQNGEVEL